MRARTRVYVCARCVCVWGGVRTHIYIYLKIQYNLYFIKTRRFKKFIFNYTLYIKSWRKKMNAAHNRTVEIHTKSEPDTHSYCCTWATVRANYVRFNKTILAESNNKIYDVTWFHKLIEIYCNIFWSGVSTSSKYRNILIRIVAIDSIHNVRKMSLNCQKDVI